MLCALQMNEMLNGLVHEISTMTTLYGEEKLDRSQKQHTNSAIFLSRVPLEHYYKEEEKFTRQLTQYTKKQFDRVSNLECFMASSLNFNYFSKL